MENVHENTSDFVVTWVVHRRKPRVIIHRLNTSKTLVDT